MVTSVVKKPWKSCISKKQRAYSKVFWFENGSNQERRKDVCMEGLYIKD